MGLVQCTHTDIHRERETCSQDRHRILELLCQGSVQQQRQKGKKWHLEKCKPKPSIASLFDILNIITQYSLGKNPLFQLTQHIHN